MSEFCLFNNFNPPKDLDQTRFCDATNDDIPVSQHLTPEQYKFEFPAKQLLRELEYLDHNKEFSFFDDYSFSLEDTVYGSVLPHSYENMSFSIKNVQDDDELIDDSRLSPLQLPAQMKNNVVEAKSSSFLPVGPSSFLSDSNKISCTNQNRLATLQKDENEPSFIFSINESVPTMDRDLDSSTTNSSVHTADSKVVLIKLVHNHQKNNKTPFVIQSSPSFLLSDEGYDDRELEEDELESQCVFYPLSEDEEKQEHELVRQEKAAIKIQSAWRGYWSRKQQFKHIPAPQKVTLNLLQLNSSFQSNQMRQTHQKIAALEQKLREETAMRMAFEKAMENMTVLIDQQQKVLYDRLEQEVHMRQLYEEKMNQALNQLPILENKLKKEMNARSKLEDMMTRVLDQLHESETQRIRQLKEDAEHKKSISDKLDQVMEEMAILKKKNIVSSSNLSTQKSIPSSLISPSSQKPINTTKKSTIVRLSPPLPKTRPISQNTKISSTSSIHTKKSLVNTGLPVERPSIIPFSRRPMSSINQNRKI